MKQGGSTANGNVHGKPMRPRFNCKVCGRSYGQAWTKDRHQKECERLNKK